MLVRSMSTSLTLRATNLIEASGRVVLNNNCKTKLELKGRMPIQVG